MEYWIDGYNLLLRRGLDREGSLEAARGRLLRSLVPLGVPCRAYFDARKGAPSGDERDASPATTVRARFVRDRSADDAMIDDLRGVPRGSVVLVTDDRELRGRARQLGAATLGVARFVEKLDLAASPVRPKDGDRRSGAARGPAEGGRDARLSKREVDEWMKLFGFDDPAAPPS